jgi:hypothetical protein
MIHGMQNIINKCYKFVSMEEIEQNGTAGLTVTTKQNFQKSFQQWQGCWNKRVYAEKH